MAHDLGTTGNKATLYDASGKLLGSATVNYPISTPKDGWVEQDPDDWWRAVCLSTRELLERSGVAPGAVSAVCFSDQMMGVQLVDKQSNPLRPMITWADTRASLQEARMLSAVPAEEGYRVTGHRLSASYSAAKLLWVKDNEPELYRKAHKTLNAKDYVILKLTGAFVTDYSDASGTNLLDLKKRAWSEDLLGAFEIRADLMPEALPSTAIAGHITPEAARATGLLQGTPVVMGGGDGSCACVGAGVVKAGDAYNIIGTSSWISTAATEPYYDPDMRTFNWVHLDENLFTPCGTMQAAGFSYRWYRDTLGGEEAALAEAAGQDVYDALGALALTSAPGAGNLLYLPYLLGERSPRWNHAARGAFIGLNASTTKADMTRAVLEGVGYNLRVILSILESAVPVERIVMLGGGAKGQAWLQILADIWQRELLVPAYIGEGSSIGAAICGGVGVGVYKDFAQCAGMNPIVRTVKPNPENAGTYERMYNLFEDIYPHMIPIYDMMKQEG